MTSSSPNRLSGLAGLAAFAVADLMPGALIVLDDLERRAPALLMSEVLGCIMRLVEVRRCLVLVICNEDKLNEIDKDALDREREKVFDLEHAFEPSVEDSVAAIVPPGKERARILWAFVPLRINNLRIISKAAAAVAYVMEKLREIDSVSPDIQERILKNVVYLVGPRWQSGEAAVAELIERWKINDGPIVSSLIYPASAADSIIAEYLRSGKIDSSRLRDAAQVQDRWARSKVAGYLADRIDRAFNDSFNPLPKDLISEAERLLNGPLQDYDWSFLHRIITILTLIGRSVEQVDVERRWANEWKGDVYEEVVAQLKDEKARNSLNEQPHYAEQLDREARARIKENIEESRSFFLTVNKRFLEDPEWVCSVLNSLEMPDLLTKLEKIMLELRRDAKWCIAGKVSTFDVFKQAFEEFSRSGRMARH